MNPSQVISSDTDRVETEALDLIFITFHTLIVPSKSVTDRQ